METKKDIIISVAEIVVFHGHCWWGCRLSTARQRKYEFPVFL